MFNNSADSDSDDFEITPITHSTQLSAPTIDIIDIYDGNDINIIDELVSNNSIDKDSSHLQSDQLVGTSLEREQLALEIQNALK